MSLPQKDFVAAWRRQLTMSGVGSTSRRHKSALLVALGTGEADTVTLDKLVRNVGLYSTDEASKLAKATVEHITNHLSDKPEEAVELRRQLLELVPEDERPIAEPAPAT